MARNPILTKRARSLRSDMTSPERRLWPILRQLNRAGCHFRRQVPIGPYIVDFAWLSLGLVIEIDGDSHTSMEAEAADLRRDRVLQGLGHSVLRIWNADALGNPEGAGELVIGTVNRLLAAKGSRLIDWDGPRDSRLR